MTKFLNKLKKTLFLAEFWSIFPILEKTNDTIPRKGRDRQRDRQRDKQKGRQEDGQTLFHGTLSATARGPILTLEILLMDKSHTSFIAK